MRIFCLTASLMLAACSQVDKPSLTSFLPTDSGFTYSARADAYYTLDGGETDRIEWLEEYLRDNNICETGYRIDDRRIVKVSEGLAGDIYDVHYRGTCVR